MDISSENKVQRELAMDPGRLSVISLVNYLIEDAHARRASDIHIDPQQDQIRVRLRIDGVLHDAYMLPKPIHNEIISRIKIMASLRTDEHQAAQDGRFRSGTGAAAVDVRISITPTYYGENAVLRLLSDRSEDYALESLGFSEENRQKLERAIRKPYGMILATGPTGSGKTTTLYTIVKSLNVPGISIITVEDPIEYSIDGINQIQVNATSGLTFANGLRSILRQDPNIIMVGEIRDAETASIAVNTALTGHLLLSSLHTNDAATTLPRLLDLGIEPYLIASTVNIAIGQRLVRKICADCKTEQILTAKETASLAAVMPKRLMRDNDVFWHGSGCESCGGSGYRGRIGIQEVMLLDGPVREAILRKASADEIKIIAVKHGMKTMLEDGIAKACAGVTTVEEVLRMLHE